VAQIRKRGGGKGEGGREGERERERELTTESFIFRGR
jgi:hypothetical protein